MAKWVISSGDYHYASLEFDDEGVLQIVESSDQADRDRFSDAIRQYIRVFDPRRTEFSDVKAEGDRFTVDLWMSTWVQTRADEFEVSSEGVDWGEVMISEDDEGERVLY